MSPERLVHIVDRDGVVPSGRPVMLVSLDGFLDAGNAAALAVAHLGDADAGKVVASFEVDELHDYRARRPAMSFVRDHYESYDAPRLVVRLLRDIGEGRELGDVTTLRDPTVMEHIDEKLREHDEEN